ncbi:uncharacterized protein htr6 [Scyliorhinus torazame]|uniref:uncharacterized protein htr6 n=1 Tax=Scyliorhinus torazame TaxID=75743 RepID=UPI003B5B629A
MSGRTELSLALMLPRLNTLLIVSAQVPEENDDVAEIPEGDQCFNNCNQQESPSSKLEINQNTGCLYRDSTDLTWASDTAMATAPIHALVIHAQSTNYGQWLQSNLNAANRPNPLDPSVNIQIRGAQNPSARTSASRKFTTKHSKRALKASLTLGILLGMFFVAWLPFFVANVTQAVCDCVPALLFDVLTWLGYCNSTMNPIIYPLFMRDFKRAMAKYLPCCRRWWERRPSVVSFSMRNSNSAPRLALRPETDSVESVTQVNGNMLLPAAKVAEDKHLEVTGADSLHLFELEHSDHDLHVNQLNTPMD